MAIPRDYASMKGRPQRNGDRRAYEEAWAERNDYAGRLKATDQSWATLASERDRLKGDFAAAVSGYQAALKLMPDTPELYSNLGLAYYLDKKYEKSITAFQEALKEKPSLVAPHLFLGMAYVRTSQYEKSIDPLKKAIELDPKLRQAYINLSASYDSVGNDDEALANDQQLLPLYQQHFGLVHEDTLQLQNNIAIGLRSLGRFAEALLIDEAVLADREHALGDTDEQTLISRFAVARDLRRLGRYEDALDLIRQVNSTLDQENRSWTLFRLLVGSEGARGIVAGGGRPGEDAAAPEVKAAGPRLP